jgi:Domain of unknown function (DUF6504)
MSRRIGIPVPVELRPDGQPAAFTWRGERYRVLKCKEPWHLMDRWWVSAAEVDTNGGRAFSDRWYYRIYAKASGASYGQLVVFTRCKARSLVCVPYFAVLAFAAVYCNRFRALVLRRDRASMPNLDDPGMLEFQRGTHGEYISLRIDRDHVATAVAESEEDGWDIVAIAPYQLDTDTGAVTEYLLVLRK